MEQEGKENYELLVAICQLEEKEWATGYRLMRELLERLCRSQLEGESLQMTDLSARISYVATKVNLSVSEQNRLHTFRLTSNAVLNRRTKPEQDKLLRDAKTLAFFNRKLVGEEIPKALIQLLPQADATYLLAPPSVERKQRMRVCYQGADEHYLYVTPLDEIAEAPLRVRYNLPEINEEFAETCQLLWPHAQLNLLDVTTDEQGIITPAFIVLEPDYLIDISALAECYKDYGHHPGNYFLARMQPIENARPLLLGNIANLFLDEWIYADKEPDYICCMQKAFRRYPIELAACSDLYDREKEQQFFGDCKRHFEHLREVVTQTFQAPGYALNKADAVLEPSYICEALGLQGRLDYMQRDLSAFIEMKSGKADEYAIRGKIEPKENNRVQMLLYQAVLEYAMGMNHRRVKSYLLYTRYPLLYPARPSWAMLRRVINLRNRIVADEYAIQRHNSTAYTAEKLSELSAEVLNERQLTGRFWESYLRPSIDSFGEKLHALSAIEKSYFYTLYNFITKELYTSKSGDSDYEGRSGASGLWLSTLAEKEEAGEIIYHLHLKENHAADLHKAYLVFERREHPNVATEQEGMGAQTLPNFRTGDAIVLYERLSESDNVSNRLIFKGNIEELTEKSITVRLRASQRNRAVLPPDSLYAIEHDVMDTGYRAMYQNLYAFLCATPRRRALLLGQREPGSDKRFDEGLSQATTDFERIALKALAAEDFFLLIGPPGTGKTSCALKLMVERFYHQEQAHILLLSYTNRAVDEICKMLSRLTPTIDYIRIGSELPCDPAYRDHLIENQLAGCNRRTEVYERLAHCRIVVGTVAAISGKPELFRLKHFDVAIVDEATQILEPQLLGILCANSSDGKEAIDKFVLIGDHKQLPAVVLQRSEHAEVADPLLRAIGLYNLKDSLFERLYRTERQRNETAPNCGSYDMLCRQGRMHPAVAQFSNQAFYESRLLPVGLPHQLEEYHTVCRLAFYPSKAEPMGASGKINHSEAQIAALLAQKIYEESPESFDPSATLGIMAPYRSQIALIKQALEKRGIPALNQVVVDTVERFQGSERDVIIYSFCINYPYQLRQLADLTEENGVIIDRKLNVALTRARKQMFITGVPALLERNTIYQQLLKVIEKYRSEK